MKLKSFCYYFIFCKNYVTQIFISGIILTQKNTRETKITRAENTKSFRLNKLWHILKFFLKKNKIIYSHAQHQHHRIVEMSIYIL